MSTLQVLYEDNHLIVVNKPAGILVQADKTGDETLADQVKQYLKRKYKKPGDVFLGTIHRLDRPVSGVVVFARTSKALERMNKLFRDREVKKVYWALSRKRPPLEAGSLENFILKNTKNNKAHIKSKEGKGAQKSFLEYELKGRIAEYYLIEVKPETGRPHQIRVQLSHAGCPIVGDVKYGDPKGTRDKRIYLHSREISFVHPVKKEKLRVTAGLPNEQVWQMFKGI
jgi:23S rRNA pseudouridine1911/1915/1917 synthase